MGRGDGGAVADGLGGVFVGVCGRVVGAVDADHGGLDAVGGDEAIVGEVLDESCVCCAGAAPGHADASML